MNKNKILILLSCTVLILIAVVIILVTRPKPINPRPEDLIRSEERVRMLERSLLKKDAEIEKIKHIEDSLQRINSKNEESRDYYKKLYYYEKNRVANLPLDSGVVFLSEWLSKGDTL